MYMNAYMAVTKPYLGHMMMDTFPFPGNAEVRTFFPPSVISVRNLSPRILYQLNITGGPFSWLIIIYCHLSHDDLRRTAAFDMACSYEGSIYLTSWGTCIHPGLRRCYIHKCRTICGQWMCGIEALHSPVRYIASKYSIREGILIFIRISAPNKVKAFGYIALERLQIPHGIPKPAANPANL
ncbi:hypothetical protein BDV36DRAFT_139478 [Aspergillus pseudocaelatus]|uniref:Uncharacterized protein n=1 Tax=Aspergillus pseudocaelatus TaxID=1825620 RepID=A0ABQ6WQB6_9EURO|nr:hypothetical protein BDV36DRAFT_139478 [Aspergillus pseudocaelatus]